MGPVHALLKIIPNLAEVKPEYFPSVPRIFEKIYTAATGKAEKAGGIQKRIFWWAIGVGKKVRELLGVSAGSASE